MIDVGEWKKLTPGLCAGGDERLALQTDIRTERRENILKDVGEVILMGHMA